MPLAISPSSGPAGTRFLVTLTTSTADGTQYPYVITGTNISVASLGSQITGTFVISNNTASFFLLTGSVPGSTFYVSVPSLSDQNSAQITFTPAFSTVTGIISTITYTTSTFLQTGASPLAGMLGINFNPFTYNTATYYQSARQGPVPGLSLLQINYNPSTSTYGLSILQSPIIPILTNIPIVGIPVKVTSQADTGYGNTPVTPLGQPLVKEFWL